MSPLAFVMIITLGSMVLMLIQGFRGPTTYDRILCVNVFGSATVLGICLLSFLMENVMLLDMALLYGLVNFIATIALLKYFKYGSFDPND